jgi:polysaccharide export outer membrane protein
MTALRTSFLAMTALRRFAPRKDELIRVSQGIDVAMKRWIECKINRILLVGTTVLQLAACASGGPSLPADECPATRASLSDYVIGAGDTLQIVVWRDAELSTTIPVRPDGKISTPLIEDMVASGKTPSELGTDMEVVLSEYLRTPKVSVIVIQQGATNQIQVVGEVAAPQALAYRENLRILDLVVAVGGLSDFAAPNRANLVRPTENGQVECRVHIKDLMSGDMSQNILVFPGDVLVIPETRF